MVGSSPWMPHPSAAQLVFSISWDRPIPFREELTMDCLAFQASMPVVRSWDRTAESQNAARWYEETNCLLAGTEVFAPVYEQIHLISFIDVWSSWLRKLILNLNYIKLQKDSQRWQSTCRIRTIATLTWNSRIRAKRQQHFSILARCSDCLLIVFLSPGLGMFRNSSWAVSAGFAGQGSTVLLKTASKSSLSCHLLARTVCKAKAHQGTKTYENTFFWVAPGERKQI